MLGKALSASGLSSLLHFLYRFSWFWVVCSLMVGGYLHSVSSSLQPLHPSLRSLLGSSRPISGAFNFYHGPLMI